jgi:hypothetical protein
VASTIHETLFGGVLAKILSLDDVMGVLTIDEVGRCSLQRVNTRVESACN